MGDQTSLVSRQEREANAKNQPMFRKRLFKDILIAISGSFRTGTSNIACCMMSSPWLPFTLTIGKLRKRAQQNIPEDNVLPPSGHVTHINSRNTQAPHRYMYIQYICIHKETEMCKQIKYSLTLFVSFVPRTNSCFFLTFYADLNVNTEHNIP